MACGATPGVDYLRLVIDGNNEPGGTDVMRIECSERGGLLLIKRLRILHYSDDVIPWGSVAEDGPVSLGMDMGARVLSRDDCDVIFELVDAGGFWDVVDAKRRRALPKEVEDRLDNLVGWGTPPVLEGIREGFYNLHYDPIQTQKPLRSLEYLYDNLHI